jgi:hypothetical protein
VFVSIEQSLRELRPLVISHATKLPREELELRSRLSLDKDHYRAFREAVNPHLGIVDLSREELRRCWSGPVGAIQKAIVSRLPEGKEVAGVVIDYAGVAVEHYLSDAVNSGNSHYLLLHQFVPDSRRLLAERFRCPVWLIHQLNGRANQLSPGALQRHSDASECPDFDRHLDGCFVLGTLERTTGLFVVHCTKSRTITSGCPSPVVARIDNATVKEVPGYDIDPITKRIRQCGIPSVAVDDETRCKLRSMCDDARCRSDDERSV